MVRANHLEFCRLSSQGRPFFTTVKPVFHRSTFQPGAFQTDSCALHWTNNEHLRRGDRVAFHALACPTTLPRLNAIGRIDHNRAGGGGRAAALADVQRRICAAGSRSRPVGGAC